MTVWRSTTTAFLVGGLVIIVFAAAIAFMLNNFHPTTSVKLGSGDFTVRVATDETSRQLGLSDVTSLRPTEGLLMVFESDDTWDIWMKDMKVPLDILWLDKGKNVIYIVKNAAPELSTTTIFRPKNPARYVLELSAGSVDEFGIKTGNQAEFTVEEGS